MLRPDLECVIWVKTLAQVASLPGRRRGTAKRCPIDHFRRPPAGAGRAAHAHDASRRDLTMRRLANELLAHSQKLS